jgi:hypothetical protein
LFETDPKTGKRKFKFGFIEDAWEKRVDKEIADIKEKAKNKSEGKEQVFTYTTFEPGQDDDIKALKRHKGKVPFEVLARGFYIAEEGKLNSSNITGLIGCLKQYTGDNKFKLGKYTDISDALKDVLYFVPVQSIKDYFMKRRRWEMEEEMFDAYKKRSIFYPPYEHTKVKPYVMSAEAVATFFHVIGTVSRTPTLTRMDSKKSEPPANLPV